MARRIRFHGVANFPWLIPAKAETLGALDRIRIEKHSIGIALPVASSEANGAPLVAPLDYRKEPLAEPLLSSSTGSWGYRSSADLYYIAAARASFVLAPETNMATSSEFLELSQAFLKWFDIVRYWAAAWTQQPLHDTSKPHGSILQIPTSDDLMAGTPVRLGSVFFGATPLSLAQLRSVFKRASRGDQLPVEHRLLLSARLAQMAKDNRLAVIEAGSAAEIALATAISNEFQKNQKIDVKFINQTIENANGVAGLVSLYLALDQTLPISKNRVGNELARIRNLAVHGGHIPEDPETQLAVNHASALVQSARPLPVI